MTAFRPSRRWLLGAGTALLAGSEAAPQQRQSSPGSGGDGIGGTGRMSRSPDDRGIGGTGVYGRITDFGSIIVNGARIRYPGSASVRIFGRPARVQAMKIGHVVAVTATNAADGLGTRAIEIEHLVVGPVEGRAWLAGGFTVLGQLVLPPDHTDMPSVGEWVAISGFRRADGAIAASLIEPAPDRIARVTGIVQAAPGGRTRIGALLLGGDTLASRVGQRLALEGNIEGDGLRVTASRLAMIVPARTDRLLVEGFLRFENNRVVTAEGALSGRFDGSASDIDLQEPQALAFERQADGSFMARLIDPAAASASGGRGRGGRGGPGPGAPGPGGPGPGGGRR